MAQTPDHLDEYRYLADVGTEQLKQQSSSVDEIRVRSAYTFSGLAVLVSLLAARALSVHPPKYLLVAAVLGLAAGVILFGAVTWPRRGWVFQQDVQEMIGWLENEDLSPEAFYRSQAYYAEESGKGNSSQIRTLMFLFTTMVGVLGLDVMLWIAADLFR